MSQDTKPITEVILAGTYPLKKAEIGQLHDKAFTVATTETRSSSQLPKPNTRPPRSLGLRTASGPISANASILMAGIVGTEEDSFKPDASTGSQSGSVSRLQPVRRRSESSVSGNSKETVDLLDIQAQGTPMTISDYLSSSLTTTKTTPLQESPRVGLFEDRDKIKSNGCAVTTPKCQTMNFLHAQKSTSVLTERQRIEKRDGSAIPGFYNPSEIPDETCLESEDSRGTIKPDSRFSTHKTQARPFPRFYPQSRLGHYCYDDSLASQEIYTREPPHDPRRFDLTSFLRETQRESQLPRWTGPRTTGCDGADSTMDPRAGVTEDEDEDTDAVSHCTIANVRSLSPWEGCEFLVDASDADTLAIDVQSSKCSTPTMEPDRVIKHRRKTRRGHKEDKVVRRSRQESKRMVWQERNLPRSNIVPLPDGLVQSAKALSGTEIPSVGNKSAQGTSIFDPVSFSAGRQNEGKGLSGERKVELTEGSNEVARGSESRSVQAEEGMFDKKGNKQSDRDSEENVKNLAKGVSAGNPFNEVDAVKSKLPRPGDGFALKSVNVGKEVDPGRSRARSKKQKKPDAKNADQRSKIPHAPDKIPDCTVNIDQDCDPKAKRSFLEAGKKLEIEDIYVGRFVVVSTLFSTIVWYGLKLLEGWMQSGGGTEIPIVNDHESREICPVHHQLMMGRSEIKPYELSHPAEDTSLCPTMAEILLGLQKCPSFLSKPEFITEIETDVEVAKALPIPMISAYLGAAVAIGISLYLIFRAGIFLERHTTRRRPRPPADIVVASSDRRRGGPGSFNVPSRVVQGGHVWMAEREESTASSRSVNSPRLNQPGSDRESRREAERSTAQASDRRGIEDESNTTGIRSTGSQHTMNSTGMRQTRSATRREASRDRI